MNRTEKLKERKSRAEHQKDIEQKELEADVKKKAEISRRFINDKRHAEFKALIELAVKVKQSQYETLGETVKDNDELLRKGLILTTEIKTLNWILYTPDKFIEIEAKMNAEAAK